MSGKSHKRALGIAFSLAAHGAMLAALFWAHGDAPKPPDPQPIAVSLVNEPTLAPTLTAPAPAQPQQAQPPPQPSRVRPSPAPPDPRALAADPEPAPSAELSEAQIAGAATAASGPAGGPCDMARRLQAALRKDPMVQAAVARTAGKAIMVWNGDWVRNGGEDGKGLAVVRESITWEIAFAPEGCRSKPVHGLVLLSLDDGPGAARLAVGADDWRWTDLLNPRSAQP